MASTGRGRRPEFKRKVFMPSTPRFFKIMTNCNLDQGKIAIPLDFILKYRSSLSSSVVLKAPSGERFPVRLANAEGRVWLERGWRKFEDYYSLKTGSMIIFELQWNNLFEVTIYGSRCTEIDYPVGCLSSPGMEEAGDENQVLESSEASEPQPKRRRRPSRPSTSRHPIELDNSSPTVSLESESGSEFKAVSEPSSESDVECLGIGRKAVPPNRTVLKPRIVKMPLPPSSHKALEAAKNYKSQYPCFRVRLRPSYMRSGGISICSKFMKDNDFEVGKREVKLKHSGKTWKVKMFCYATEYRGKLCSGWGTFLEDNRLANGDVCVFDLVRKAVSDQRKAVFKVHLFRCSNYS